MTTSLLDHTSDSDELPLENRSLKEARNSIAALEEEAATNLLSPPISIQTSFQERVIGMDLAHKPSSNRSIERKFNFTSHSLGASDKDIQQQHKFWQNSL